MIIAVDMDATMTQDEWPRLGPNVPWAFEVVRELVRNGHKIILLTQREHVGVDDVPDVLQVAIDKFVEERIPLYSVNSFPEEDNVYFPSRKVYADVYVDDHNAGIQRKPYINGDGDNSPYVDWEVLDEWFVREGYYQNRVCKA